MQLVFSLMHMMSNFITGFLTYYAYTNYTSEVGNVILAYLIGDLLIGLPFDILLAYTALSPNRDSTMTLLKTQVFALVFPVLHASLRSIYTFWVLEQASASLTKAGISLTNISGALLHLFSYLLIIALAGSQGAMVAISSVACFLYMYKVNEGTDLIS